MHFVLFFFFAIKNCICLYICYEQLIPCSQFYCVKNVCSSARAGLRDMLRIYEQQVAGVGSNPELFVILNRVNSSAVVG